MRIIARFHCHTVLKAKDQETVTLQPVYSDKKDSPNYTWSQYTPTGKIEMTITNPAALGKFEPGKAYNIEFSQVEEAAAPAAG